MDSKQFDDFFANSSADDIKSIMPKNMLSFPQHFDQMMEQMDKNFGTLMPKMSELTKGDGFGKFPDMEKLSQEMTKQGLNGGQNNKGYTHCHSSFTTFDQKGKKYQKTHTVTTGPDGVKQEQKTLEDRDKEYKEMMLGNHIKSRGIEIEKSKTGNQPIQTKRNLIGLQENEVASFEKDWSKHVGASSGLLNIGMGNPYGRVGGRRNSGQQKAVKFE